MNWKNAFHPSNHIGDGEIERVVSVLEESGCDCRRDCLGRIVGVRDFVGNDVLRDFFPPTDDPAKFLPKTIIDHLDGAFAKPEDEGEQFSLGLV